MPDTGATNLSRFIRENPRLTILSGAGCSTASGIPDYRDDLGKWKHRQPMQFSDFVNNANNRRRYWAQSFAGWSRIANAKPNRAHLAIARLEKLGFVNCVVTQNVDDLHKSAGSRRVIDLHGILHRIRKSLLLRRMVMRSSRGKILQSSMSLIAHCAKEFLNQTSCSLVNRCRVTESRTHSSICKSPMHYWWSAPH